MSPEFQIMAVLLMIMDVQTIHLEDVISQEKWSDWLALPESEKTTHVLRRNIEKGLPCGADEFIEKLERLANKPLKFRPQGRPTSQKG